MNSEFTDLFGPEGFVFLDDRPWPFLVQKCGGEWWLYYWSEGNKNFVTLRRITEDEVERFRAHALPAEKEEFYKALARANQPKTTA